MIRSVTGGTLGSTRQSYLRQTCRGRRAGARLGAPQDGVAPSVEAVSGYPASGGAVGDAVRGADTIIHLAGVIKALTSADYYLGNTRATENLARAAAGRRIRFIHVSSLAVSCGPSFPGEEGCVDEDSEPRPLTHYGKSKLEAERIPYGRCCRRR